MNKQLKLHINYSKMTKKEKELGELTYEDRYNKDAMADRKELEEQLMS